MYRNGVKRALDIGLSLVSGVILSPVLLLIAIAIKLADPGPVIFRQQRIGAGGRTFAFYKFRSMPVDTGDIPSDRLGEVRLSWIGRLIRRTNLDELPQLWNVLKGDMSLVGPRPPIPSQAELIALRRENGALALRPGLTGWAQVNSYDGMSVAAKAALDGDYARTLSPLKDVQIILRTFLYLLRPPPKY
jgi:O-antigen biosynthesis protein WbqP